VLTLLGIDIDLGPEEPANGRVVGLALPPSGPEVVPSPDREQDRGSCHSGDSWHTPAIGTSRSLTTRGRPPEAWKLTDCDVGSFRCEEIAGSM
jgi:hypothetical protein